MENISFDEILNEFRDELSKFQLDGDFLRVVFIIVKIIKYSHETKMCFLNLVV